MRLNIETFEDKTATVDVSPKDSIEDVQRALVEQFVDDITEFEMENSVWRTRYYLYQLDNLRGHSEDQAHLLLDETVAETALGDGDTVLLNQHGNSPPLERYECQGDACEEEYGTWDDVARPDPGCPYCGETLTKVRSGQ